MRYASLVAVGIAWLVLVAPAWSDRNDDKDHKKIERKVPDRETFLERVKQIEEDGEALLERTDPNGDPETRVIDLKYDKDMVPLLRSQLFERRRQQIGAYVAYQLLRPLLDSDVETIRVAMPHVLVIQRRYGRYLPLPNYSEAQLRALEYPDDIGSPARMLATVERVTRKREEKIKRDWLFAFPNKNAAKLETLVYHLMLLSKDSKYDRVITRNVEQEFRKKTVLGLRAMRAVAEHADTLTKERAKRYYDWAMKRGEELKYVKEKCLDPGEIDLQPEANSSHGHDEVLVGREFYKLAVAVADKAGEKEPKVPSDRDIKEYIKKHKKK